MNVPRYVVLEKPRGETPLETIQHWKTAHPLFADLRTSYAGRLDPMAEGKLLVLIGEECKRQPAYTKLDKEYEIEIVLDLATDTGDALGMSTYKPMHTASGIYEARDVQRALNNEIGAHVRAYPAFSSKTVQGKPLFLYALEGTLDTILIPEHIERIYKIKLLNQYVNSSKQLLSRIDEALAVVPRSTEPSKILGADFRQDAIRTAWADTFATIPERNFTVLHVRVTCGPGAYMRTLAQHIGASLGTTAFALSIKRTKIGKFISFGPCGFWTRQYR